MGFINRVEETSCREEKFPQKAGCAGVRQFYYAGVI